MARSGPNSATGQFFICINNQPALDYGGARNPDGQGFAAFGRVIKGMEVVRLIQSQKDTSQYLVKPVKIYEVSRVEWSIAGDYSISAFYLVLTREPFHFYLSTYFRESHAEHPERYETCWLSSILFLTNQQITDNQTI